ncbi:MAG: hypothetical protein V7K41_16940 [Nostoc sp.]|uniref:hypothetical protein n=1 Tax=Nostoc sp. TaxID=1180 RepID=UPI002FF8BA72
MAFCRSETREKYSTDIFVLWSYDGSQGFIGIGAFAGTMGDTTQSSPVFKLVQQFSFG